MRVSSRDAEELAKKQSETYSSVIGSGNVVSPDIIHAVSDAARLLKPHSKYTEYAEIRFIWEMFDMGEYAALVRKLVDAWVEVWQ